jgi:NTP pyrophosphatase (non-canonical NTP hydrolase)
MNNPKESDKNKDLGEELADVVLVLCLANQTGIDLQALSIKDGFKIR